VSRAAGVFELTHAVAEHLLIAVGVGVGHHQRHERAGLRCLGARRRRLGQDGLSDLIEQGDVLGAEAPHTLRHRLLQRIGVERECIQTIGIDEREPAHQRHHVAHGVAACDPVSHRSVSAD
jgi:hypothetical protein